MDSYVIPACMFPLSRTSTLVPACSARFRRPDRHLNLIFLFFSFFEFDFISIFYASTFLPLPES